MGRNEKGQFTNGNQLWKLALGKLGRPPKYTPETLLKAAEDYFIWNDANPWVKKEAIKSGDLAGTTMDIETERPYTIAAFCLHAGISSAWMTEHENLPDNHQYKADFLNVINVIKAAIRTQKFEGATVGVFNSNIIARDLGLADKTDHTTNGKDINQQNTIVFNGKEVSI